MWMNAYFIPAHLRLCINEMSNRNKYSEYYMQEKWLLTRDVLPHFKWKIKLACELLKTDLEESDSTCSWVKHYMKCQMTPILLQNYMMQLSNKH